MLQLETLQWGRLGTKPEQCSLDMPATQEPLGHKATRLGPLGAYSLHLRTLRALLAKVVSARPLW